MKRLLTGLLCLCLILSGCAAPADSAKKQYHATFLTLFDTVTRVTGLAESQEAFEALAQSVHDELLVYHQLFDIYNEYPGMNNLKTLNDRAGQGPVKVDGRIIALLKDCKAYDTLTGSKVNAAMGSVLQLWHEARNDSFNDPQNAYLPDFAKLEAAAKHTDFSCVLIDEAASTVTIIDPNVRLDVGAIAMGGSVQRVTETIQQGMLISVGGNVAATAPKDEKGTPWTVGIQDPRSDGYLHSLYVKEGSVVTSGDYQRNFAVDGELYHHIIDPDTLYPSAYWSSVTVVCRDSGLGDVLSTALFLLPQEEGQALLDAADAMAMWVDREGNIFYSPGFESLIRT